MKHIHISIEQQTLQLNDDHTLINEYIISSAKNGIGSTEGSYCTPIGKFFVDEKHGYNAPPYTIFKSRQPQEIWDKTQNDGDLILSRILWLQGSSTDNANTKQRYIYIHGTNHEDLLGTPHSCGCIRMANKDVIELYEQVSIGTSVTIE